MTEEELQTKLLILRQNFEALARIPQSSFDEFARDFRNLDSALYRLQTSIQALIDLGSFKLARLGLAAPTSNREILERLEEHGHLPSGSTRRYGPMFGFRNRVGHLYDQVNPRIVYRVLTEERSDLERLLDLLLAIDDEA